MSFPKLTFPLIVDFGSTGYWVGDQGPYKYGAAVTVFFCGDDLADEAGDGLALMRDLERYLQTFGSHLQPYVREEPVDGVLFLSPEQGAASCSVCFAFHPVEGGVGAMVERYTFSSLRDFLYVEMGKAIERGNCPRQCRLCGKWFLHENGDRTMYCGRFAPGESEKTCREMGARMVFEKKIQDEEPWKLYKRAYKKYYARLMKDAMSKEDFRAWADRAIEVRDTAIQELEGKEDAEWKAQRIEALREELNRE